MTATTTSPTITNFSVPTKTYGDIPFTLTDPSSNSDGSFNYISSNTSVATISGNIVTIIGAGSSNITATQAVTYNYTSGTIDASFQVIQSSPTNPLIITSGDGLLYFMNTTSEYAIIINSVEITDTLTSLNGFKTLLAGEPFVQITQI